MNNSCYASESSSSLMFNIIDLDTNERGEEIMEDRPCGANSECRQAAKTINANGQKMLRAEKRRRELAKKFNEANVEHNVIKNILERNEAVELHLRSNTTSNLLEDNTLQHFQPLVVDKLNDFIWQKFPDRKANSGGEDT